MALFPLTMAGRIVLIIIAIVLGLGLWAMVKPQHWVWLFKRKE